MRYEEVEEQKKPSPSLGSAIPGQSLTGEPKGYAWERPPEFDKPEDALKYYIPVSYTHLTLPTSDLV